MLWTQRPEQGLWHDYPQPPAFPASLFVAVEPQVRIERFRNWDKIRVWSPIPGVSPERLILATKALDYPKLYPLVGALRRVLAMTRDEIEALLVLEALTQ